MATAAFKEAYLERVPHFERAARHTVVTTWASNSSSTACGSTPDGVMKFPITEHEKWRKVIRAAKIPAE